MYQIQAHESLSDALRRVVKEEIEDAINHLTPPLAQPEMQIHEARKCFKKIRAVLKLIRHHLGEELYHQENQFYRETALSLAGARESYVALQSLDKVIEAYPDQLAAENYTTLREHLQETHDEQAENLKHTNLESIVQSLKDASDNVDTWPIYGDNFNAIARGLRLTYRNGLRRMRYAYAVQPREENFHEWRKRVKHLWYHMRLLANIWPAGMDTYISQLDELAEFLGQEHDYADLKNILMQTDNGESLATLIDLLEVERDKLRRQARVIGLYLYTEKTDAFVNRHRAYWKIWHKYPPPVPEKSDD